MKIIRRILFILALLLYVTDINAQKFVCTDVSFSGDFSVSRMQKGKKEILGSILKLTFYDKSVRVELVGHNTDIFDKVDDNTYRYRNYSYTVTIYLNKYFGYISSLKFVEAHKKRTLTLVFKRE